MSEIYEELSRRIAWHEKEFGKKPSRLYLTVEEYDRFEDSVKERLVGPIRAALSDVTFHGVPVFKGIPMVQDLPQFMKHLDVRTNL